MICNLTKKTVISSRTECAVGLWQRARGMIGRDFDCFDAMVFDHCSSIHTCFMSIPLDVIFVSRDHKILKTVWNLMPWRLFVCCKKAFYVIELPSGTIERTRSACGDIVDLAAVMDAGTEKEFGSALLRRKAESAVRCEKKD